MDAELEFSVQNSTTGQQLFDQVRKLTDCTCICEYIIVLIFYVSSCIVQFFLIFNSVYK